MEVICFYHCTTLHLRLHVTGRVAALFHRSASGGSIYTDLNPDEYTDEKTDLPYQ
jgi:hypothetical protein